MLCHSRPYHTNRPLFPFGLRPSVPPQHLPPLLKQAEAQSATDARGGQTCQKHSLAPRNVFPTRLFCSLRKSHSHALDERWLSKIGCNRVLICRHISSLNIPNFKVSVVLDAICPHSPNIYPVYHPITTQYIRDCTICFRWVWSWPISRSTCPQLSRTQPQDNSVSYKRFVTT